MPDIDKHMIHDPMDLQKYKQRNKIKSSVISRLLAEVWSKNGDKPCYLPESYLVTCSTIHSQTQPIFPVLQGQTQAWHSCRSTPGTGMESSGPRHQSVRQKMNAIISLLVSSLKNEIEQVSGKRMLI